MDGVEMEDRTPTVGLLADSGVPERVARKLADDLAERTSREAGERWTVEVSEETLPLAPGGEIHLAEHAPELRRRHDWDYVIYLADLPIFVDQEPVVCQVSTEERAALISVPSLGGIRITARTRDLILILIRAAAVSVDDRPATAAFGAALGGAKVRDVTAPGSDLSIIVLPGRFAPLRILSGMLRSNRPGSMLPALKGSIAAAIATGAFGVFYGTIAQLADALPTWRLVAISVLVIAALSAWLILSNHLWDWGRTRNRGWRYTVDNVSTIITVGVSVLLMYLILLAVMLTMSLVVVEAGYLESQLGRPVGFGQYLDLAWLAASLGIMAGALGSSFDSDDAVREATYSKRFHERRKLFGTYDKQQRSERQRE